jgi:hypothetical protein
VNVSDRITNNRTRHRYDVAVVSIEDAVDILARFESHDLDLHQALGEIKARTAVVASVEVRADERSDPAALEVELTGALAVVDQHR